MLQRSFGVFLFYSFGMVLIVALLFAIMKWLQVPEVGNVLDWLIGLASAWWLLFIVTVPWNIHFEARETFVDAELSRKAELTVSSEDEAYARKVAKYALIFAVALHIVSSVILYALSQITPVGYVGAIVALLLTVVRPCHRGYQYIQSRLAEIRKQIKYPRQDVVDLINRFTDLEFRTTQLEKKLDPERDDSWAAALERKSTSMESTIVDLSDRIQKLDLVNREEHHRLKRDSEKAIARISADGEFLDHVSEIIRFIKTA